MECGVVESEGEVTQVIEIEKNGKVGGSFHFNVYIQTINYELKSN